MTLHISRRAWGRAIRWGFVFGAIFGVLIPIFYEYRPSPYWGWLISGRFWTFVAMLAVGVVLIAWLDDRLPSDGPDEPDGRADRSGGTT